MRVFLLASLLCLTALAGRAETPDLAAQILVADPGMTDPRFAEAIVLLISHSDDGTIGIVVNRPMGRLPMQQLVEGEPGDVTIHYGGPVQSSLIMVLHDAALASDTSIVVDENLAVTASQTEILRHLTEGQTLLTLGYAGWAPGQLEAELTAGFWAVAPAEDDILFGPDHAGKWDRARARIPLEL